MLSSLYTDPTLVAQFPYLPTLLKSIQTAVPRPVTPFYPAVTKAIETNVTRHFRGRSPVSRPQGYPSGHHLGGPAAAEPHQRGLRWDAPRWVRFHRGAYNPIRWDVGSPEEPSCHTCNLCLGESNKKH